MVRRVALVLVAWLWLAGAALALLVVPLGFLVYQSFMTPHTAANPARFTLNNFIEAYSGEENIALLFNSLQFAFGTAVLALFLGTLLAWINERTNSPFKPAMYALSIVPLIIPGILFVVAWIMLGSPKIGIINLAFQKLFGTDMVLINVYTMWGMIWVDGLHYSPMAFLLMSAAFQSFG